MRVCLFFSSQMVKNALVEERERLFGLLEGVPFLKPFPSFSNFILCEVTAGMDAKKLKVGHNQFFSPDPCILSIF